MFSFIELCRQRSVRVLLLAATVLAGSLHGQMGLGMVPMRVDYELAPGAVQSGVLVLASNAPAAVRVTGQILDFYLDDTGTPQFGREYKREAEFSCRTWVVANPMEVELNPNAQIPVRYTIRVPQTAAARSYHCGIGYTTQPTAGEMKAIGLRTAVQIVGAIYVVVGKPAIEGTVKDLRLEYVPDPKTPGWRAIVTINNAGLMHFRPVGDLDVLDQNGTVVESIQFVPMPVLPKRDQSFAFPLKLAAGEGKYTLRARVDLGGNEIQEATANVVATKTKP
ncbi:MAG TPA: hypothetical protein VLW65_22190 [Bryobacteraceae bacterium]|nr:hypothetical protein [Bryobacteraceae bacterium]